jgi:mono/diheme cytochrome c family protein
LAFGLAAILALGSARTSAAAADAKVDFAREVLPIFKSSCIECHGAQKQKGGLRLDGRAAAMKGGTTGVAIVAGKSSDSLLLHRIKGLGDEPRMPEKKPALAEEQIQLIARWIDQGAEWPESAAGEAVATTHWSFIKPVRPQMPAVKNAAWVRNPIDRFILARLEKQGLTPSSEAARETLLRRVHLDLTGIPSTPAQIEAFLADKSPDAYDKVVDRLLASPAYGERWAKRWLDEARYADSNGYSIDAPREMWRWRAWVIDAINHDMPFDQFTIEQLAGDLLPPTASPKSTVEQKIATGFHRNTMINQEGGIDPEQFRVEAVIDRVNTTGTVWLGLTVGCAQCHNHKFDPISQKDYYRFMAFLNNQDEPTLRLQPQAVADGPPAKADELTYQIEQAEIAFEKLKGSTSQEDQNKAANLKRQIISLKKQEAKLGSGTFVLEERKTPRESFLFIKGDFTRHGEPVTPGTLSALPPMKTEKDRTPNRLDLAKWIVDPDNPLTARVTVNRYWMHLFGVGLVETENDFGTQGTPPTHPELLDWLATELLRDEWSQKKLLRTIVTSATYRQSSVARKDLLEADPLNKLLGRQNRVRLDAEIVRDVSLSAAGLLVEKLGGPSVFPPQPAGVSGLGQVKREWKTSTGVDRYRRGMYTFLFRATPHPLLSGFDAPDGQSACTRRIRSNTPLQALTLLNDEAFVEAAQSLATKVLKEKSDDPTRIAKIFRLCIGRSPDAEETKILTKLLAKERAAYASEKDAEQSAWMIVARAVLNLDETITRE